MSADLVFESRGESDTSRLGAILAGVLQPGLTLSLSGQLGAGKTFFVRALAVGLGVNELHVSSPTFVVLQQYVDGRIPLAHFDVYRLGDVDEFWVWAGRSIWTVASGCVWWSGESGWGACCRRTVWS